MHRTPRRDARSRALAALACLGLAACGGAAARGRASRLVSPDVSIDLALGRARALADDGDLDGSAALLARVIASHPRDPLAHVARVRTARLRVARDDLDGASAILAEVPAGFDPALAMRVSLVRGLIDARRGETERGLRALSPLAGRMIDRGAAAEVDCAVASLEARRGRADAALLALARVESHAEGGVRWIPTGLACDTPDGRATAMRALLVDAREPQDLADTLDALPAGHPVRVDVARRLRALAEARDEMTRWLPSLADLPDTEATLQVVHDTAGIPALRLGVLAPAVGPRAGVGTEVVRAVQIALGDQRAIEIEAENEGATPAEAVAAFERLASQHPAAVIGPVFEEDVAAVAARAEALGVTLYVLSPAADGEAWATARVRPAGPPPGQRAAALAAAVRARGTRARWTVAPGVERGAFAVRVRSLLGIAGVSLAEPAGFAAAELHAVLGPWPSEDLATITARAEAAPARWVYDARFGPAGAAGVWVGAELSTDPGALSAYARLHARYCGLTGRAPGELAALAFDAARAALAAFRAVPAPPALARPWRVRAEAVGDVAGGSLPGARRCAEAPEATGVAGAQKPSRSP